VLAGISLVVRESSHELVEFQETTDAVPSRNLEEDSQSGYWDDALIDRPYNESSKRYLVFIHIIIIAYMLLGLNTVCDLYFTGALDEMVNQWDIKPDVAGATFMAAGGSAPELFTSLIGTLISNSDVGFGTIVGSAVFNVLFVIGLCGLAAKEPIKLSRWPLARDCTFYIVSLSVLAIFAKTEKTIDLWEALILFTGYIGYCILMYFNSELEAMATKLDILANMTPVTPVTPIPETGSTGACEEEIPQRSRSKEDYHHIKKSQQHFERKSVRASDPPHELPDIESITSADSKSIEDVKKPTTEDATDEDDDDIEALLIQPSGRGAQILWCLSLPVYASLYYCIPKPSERYFLYTFLLSLFWIALFSFFLVYCVEVLGEVLGIHIIVMGFTLLAAGTSIPDLVSSMAVARAGEGDMAISSSIGSNIFDILVGLPIPWVIKILFVEAIGRGNGGVGVVIKSDYILLYVLILIFMVFCVVGSIHCLGWELNRTLGVGMAMLYAIFLLIVLLVEFEKPAAFKW